MGGPADNGGAFLFRGFQPRFRSKVCPQWLRTEWFGPELQRFVGLQRFVSGHGLSHADQDDCCDRAQLQRANSLTWEVEVDVLTGADRDSVNRCGTETRVLQRGNHFLVDILLERLQNAR